MPETTSGASFFISERTRELIAASPLESRDKRITTTISSGISAYENEDPPEPGYP
jgi:hypothetical protein